MTIDNEIGIKLNIASYLSHVEIYINWKYVQINWSFKIISYKEVLCDLLFDYIFYKGGCLSFLYFYVYLVSFIIIDWKRLTNLRWNRSLVIHTCFKNEEVFITHWTKAHFELIIKSYYWLDVIRIQIPRQQNFTFGVIVVSLKVSTTAVFTLTAHILHKPFILEGKFLLRFFSFFNQLLRQRSKPSLLLYLYKSLVVLIRYYRLFD